MSISHPEFPLDPELILDLTELESNPHAQEVEFEFTYTETGSWHKVYITMEMYKQVLSSGMFESRPVHSTIIFTATCDDLGTSYMVYDFSLAGQGLKPWRLV